MAEVSYEAIDPSIDSQIVSFQALGAVDDEGIQLMRFDEKTWVLFGESMSR